MIDQKFTENSMPMVHEMQANAMEELMKQRIWCPWYRGFEDGRMKIIPVDSDGNPIGADHRYGHRWMTYSDAMDAKEKLGAVGVCHAIPEGYFSMEIELTDLTHPYIRLMLDRMSTYTEYSAYGVGLHMIGRCDIDQLPGCIDAAGRRKLDKAYAMNGSDGLLSLYIGGFCSRMVAHTGDVIGNHSINDCTATVQLTLDKDLRRDTKKRYSPTRDGSRATYHLIQLLYQQDHGEKFRSLFDNGDLSAYAHREEADLALCTMIAFCAGPNPTMIDNVYRRSALYYPGWEDAAYRDGIIQQAIAGCNGQYHRSQMPCPPFVKINDSTGKPYVSAPLLAKHIRENLDFLLVRDNGKQGLLKFVYRDGRYQFYSDDMLMGIIKKYISDYDEELIKMSQVREVLQMLLTDENSIRQTDLNADVDLINFRNGILKVTANEAMLLPHSPKYRSTIQLACNYSETETPTPVFDQFLHTLTNGDESVKQLLLEYMGVCLSNIPGGWLRKCLIMVGKGDTGKSQLKLLTERLLGADNHIGIDLDQIEARFGTGSIYGMRLAGSADMSFQSVKELRVFKMLTGGDSIMGEYKGQQSFSFVFNGVLWFCCNQLPTFGGDQGAWVYNRIMVVNCPNVIPPEQQDKQLLDKMYAERDGIVHKCIRALQTVIKNGYRFSEPESVKTARVRYMEENNSAVSFFNECMRKRITYTSAEPAHSQQVYDTYCAWYRRHIGDTPDKLQVFQQSLMNHLGINRQALLKRTNTGSVYQHYMLTNETLDQYWQGPSFDKRHM